MQYLCNTFHMLNACWHNKNCLQQAKPFWPGAVSSMIVIQTCKCMCCEQDLLFSKQANHCGGNRFSIFFQIFVPALPIVGHGLWVPIFRPTSPVTYGMISYPISKPHLRPNLKPQFPHTASTFHNNYLLEYMIELDNVRLLTEGHTAIALVLD